MQGKRLRIFFLTTFGFSWIYWFGYLRTGMAPTRSIFGFIAMDVGVWGPMLGAFLAIYLTEGKEGLSRLKKRVFNFDFPMHWYVYAALLPIAVIAFALSIYEIIDIYSVVTLTGPIWMMVVYLIVSMVLGGGLEEIGWHGFLMPELQKSMGMIPSALIVGLVWGVWCLPLWFLRDHSNAAMPYPAFILEAIGLSVILAIIDTRTHSVFPCMIFHSALYAYEWGIHASNLRMFSWVLGVSSIILAGVAMLFHHYRPVNAPYRAMTKQAWVHRDYHTLESQKAPAFKPGIRKRNVKRKRNIDEN